MKKGTIKRPKDLIEFEWDSSDKEEADNKKQEFEKLVETSKLPKEI